MSNFDLLLFNLSLFPKYTTFDKYATFYSFCEMKKWTFLLIGIYVKFSGYPISPNLQSQRITVQAVKSG